jgi:uncharacterized protein (TIGR02646 family)
VRFIRKGPEPAELARWKRENAGLPHAASFDAIDGPAKAQMRDQMMHEQGHLCAYTMAPICRPESCHIEHIQPRSHHPERQTDYTNIVLCVPGKGPGDFGAFRKGDYDVTDDNFVSPLHASCETRLRFKFSGEVAAATTTDLAAEETIEILALNHPSLVRARGDAIRLQGIGPRAKKPISASKARRLIKTIGAADTKGRIQSYCVAVRQTAEIFAKQCEDRARRLTRESAR